MQAVLLTTRNNELTAFAQGLGMDIIWSAKAAEILQAAQGAPWSLVVVDALMPGFDYKTFLIDLLKKNAMLNTVVITDMSDHDFHEDSEGLGVLAALPPNPVQNDGAQVAEQLKAIVGG